MAFDNKYNLFVHELSELCSKYGVSIVSESAEKEGLHSVFIIEDRYNSVDFNIKESKFSILPKFYENECNSD